MAYNQDDPWAWANAQSVSPLGPQVTYQQQPEAQQGRSQQDPLMGAIQGKLMNAGITKGEEAVTKGYSALTTPATAAIEGTDLATAASSALSGPIGTGLLTEGAGIGAGSLASGLTGGLASGAASTAAATGATLGAAAAAPLSAGLATAGTVAATNAWNPIGWAAGIYGAGKLAKLW
jgi:hypothetical protein